MHKKLMKRGLAGFMAIAMFLTCVIVTNVPVKAADVQTTYTMNQLEEVFAWNGIAADYTGTSVSITASEQYSHQIAWKVPQEVLDAKIVGCQVLFSEDSKSKTDPYTVKLMDETNDSILECGCKWMTDYKLTTAHLAEHDVWGSDPVIHHVHTEDDLENITRLCLMYTSNDESTVVVEGITFLTKDPIGGEQGDVNPAPGEDDPAQNEDGTFTTTVKINDLVLFMNDEFNEYSEDLTEDQQKAVYQGSEDGIKFTAKDGYYGFKTMYFCVPQDIIDATIISCSTDFKVAPQGGNVLLKLCKEPTGEDGKFENSNPQDPKDDVINGYRDMTFKPVADIPTGHGTAADIKFVGIAIADTECVVEGFTFVTERKPEVPVIHGETEDDPIVIEAPHDWDDIAAATKFYKYTATADSFLTIRFQNATAAYTYTIGAQAPVLVEDDFDEETEVAVFLKKDTSIMIEAGAMLTGDREFSMNVEFYVNEVTEDGEVTFTAAQLGDPSEVGNGNPYISGLGEEEGSLLLHFEKQWHQLCFNIPAVVRANGWLKATLNLGEEDKNIVLKLADVSKVDGSLRGVASNYSTSVVRTEDGPVDAYGAEGDTPTATVEDFDGVTLISIANNKYDEYTETVKNDEGEPEDVTYVDEVNDVTFKSITFQVNVPGQGAGSTDDPSTGDPSTDDPSNKPSDEKPSDKPSTDPLPDEPNGENVWAGAISEIASATDSKTPIKIDLSDATSTVLPIQALAAMAGKDVKVEITILPGAKWIINGKDVSKTLTENVDMGVTFGTKNIPEAAVKELAGKNTSINLTLAHSGKFGFDAVLAVDLEKANKDKYANLFYYNPTSKKYEYVTDAKISADGIAELKFTHASDYTIVIAEKSMAPNTDVKPAKTGDVNVGAWAGIAFFGCMILFGAVVVARSKRA